MVTTGFANFWFDKFIESQINTIEFYFENLAVHRTEISAEKGKPENLFFAFAYLKTFEKDLSMSNYTAIIVKSGKWYAGFVKEVPGAHSQGKTNEEVKENLKEAIKLVIESNGKHNIRLD